MRALLSLISLLLLIAAIAVWVRSYFVQDDVLFPRTDGSHWTLGIKTYPGTLDIDVIRMTIPVTDPPRWDTSELDGSDRKRARKWDKENLTLGFGHVRTNFGGQHPVLKQRYAGYHSEWFLPFWSLALFALVLPAASLWTVIQRRRRRSAALCPSCGYDLRATPGRCPECGASPLPDPAKATKDDQRGYTRVEEHSM